ncbi:MAG: hypothetical protein HY816_06635 [Candidatus Wallbacteria bacterium]|nr:hypothetical protein [Candidatus Wallbacteria bacterium]
MSQRMPVTPPTNSPRRLLLVCYDPKELEALLSHLDGAAQRPIPRSRFPLTEGALDGLPIAVTRIPFGDDPALLQTVMRELLSVAAPRRVISLGTAMACASDLEIGDMVCSRGAHQRGRAVQFGTWLEDDLLRAAPHDLRIRPGRSVTARAFVSSSAERDAHLAGCPQADIIEMEDFHVASLAAEFGAEFASVRSVTDRGDFIDHMSRRALAAEALVRLLRRTLRQQRMASSLTVVDNPPTRELGYRIVLSAASSPVSLPDAVRWSRRILSLFGLADVVPDGARIDLALTARPPALPVGLATASGQSKATAREGLWSLVHDPVTHHTRLEVSESAFHAGSLEPVDTRKLLQELPVELVALAPAEARAYAWPVISSFHIQGLNSISAEPEEGLMAATTISEFRANGLTVRDAGEARCWIYRSANASADSYFHPPYPLPARTVEDVPPGTFLIASGLGPAIDPSAAGGESANLLLLGDEQGGRLIQLLDDLCAERFRPDDLFRYDGLAARLDDSTVALSRLDRRRLLTGHGLNSLRYDPAVLRSIYSQEYDRFLADYFCAGRRPGAPKASHLLMTSRGCGYHCSFCCSGGMQPFAALDIDLLVGMLGEIVEMDRPASGEYVDVYLLDSYFNRNPERIVQLAARLETEGLLEPFQFFVRHNGLQAFLRRRSEDGLPPVVNDRLVAAYRTLGVGEVVMGVDAYTDGSIRALKTNFNQLLQKGESARPVYTFSDIAAVLAALESAGLDSRCFLLVYNPFAGDLDRIRTFYNLIRLALDAPGFMIDSSSSDRVNELKPFPGAPLTLLAERVPGLVQGERFDYETPLGRLEDLLDLEMFGSRRRSPESMRQFAARAAAARLRLAARLSDGFAAAAAHGPAEAEELRAATHAFCQEEAAISPRLVGLEDPASTAELATAVDRLSGASGHEPAPGLHGHERLYRAMRSWNLARRASPATRPGSPTRSEPSE